MCIKHAGNTGADRKFSAITDIPAEERIQMDVSRAKQILQSPEKIQVLYQDTPVWIEEVRENNVALVSRPGNQGSFEIPVYMLVEKTR